MCDFVKDTAVASIRDIVLNWGVLYANCCNRPLPAPSNSKGKDATLSSYNVHYG